MKEVTVGEARANFARLLDSLENGEDEILIRRHGKPVAKLTAVRPPKPFPFGALRGQIEETEGWEQPMTDEEADAFLEGK